MLAKMVPPGRRRSESPAFLAPSASLPPARRMDPSSPRRTHLMCLLGSRICSSFLRTMMVSFIPVKTKRISPACRVMLSSRVLLSSRPRRSLYHSTHNRLLLDSGDRLPSCVRRYPWLGRPSVHERNQKMTQMPGREVVLVRRRRRRRSLLCTGASLQRPGRASVCPRDVTATASPLSTNNRKEEGPHRLSVNWKSSL